VNTMRHRDRYADTSSMKRNRLISGVTRLPKNPLACEEMGILDKGSDRCFMIEMSNACFGLQVHVDRS